MTSEIPKADELLREGVLFFQEHFGVKPEIAGCAPGRVNLIGEHTDYNDGFVLPMALPMVTLVIGRLTSGEKRVVRLKTKTPGVDEPRAIQFDLNASKLEPGNPKWANYIKGVIANFPGEVPGFDAVILTSVPLGGGLSSSASLEVSTYTFLEGITNQVSKPSEKARACQRAEHTFAYTPCGIMDQLVSVSGVAGNATLIDCRSLEITLVPIANDDYRILITNSNVKHTLSASAYPERLQQSRDAAQLLGVASLRDASEDQLKALKNNDVLHRRARHVISEIRRTQEAKVALQSGDFEKFGTLMVESHRSLSKDYEVSCKELDELVEIALGVKGVLGSRMTGGGFGGCTVTLVHKNAVDKVISEINKKYSKHATFFTCIASDGARLLPIL